MERGVVYRKEMQCGEKRDRVKYQTNRVKGREREIDRWIYIKSIVRRKEEDGGRDNHTKK